MKMWSFVLAGSLVAAALPIANAAYANQKGETQEKGEQGEKKVSLDSIPAAARDALLREAGGAPILSVEEEQENGANVYEASVRQRNEVIGISVDANGKLVSKHSESAEHE
jgi:uncharacterized membrane protein YkoI